MWRPARSVEYVTVMCRLITTDPPGLKTKARNRIGRGLLCRLLERLNLYLIRLNLGTSSLHLCRKASNAIGCAEAPLAAKNYGFSSTGFSAVQRRREEQTTLWYNPMRTALGLLHTRTLAN